MTIPSAALAAFLVLSAIAISPVVFSEPAPVDLLLMGAVIALPLLYQTRPGLIATTVLVLMLVNVALALIIAPASADMGNDVKHQFITLYLMLAGFVIAGYVSIDPVQRADRVMVVYAFASTVAAALALIGFFRLIPGTEELFTLFGRARGTFKDPNVLGAAIAPAFVWLLWSVTSAPFAKAKWSFVALCIVGGAILLTFSRGAWLSVLASMAFTSLFLAASLRDPQKLKQFVVRFLPAVILFPIAMMALLQIETVREMAEVRFRLDQSYDSGPYGRFGGQAKALDLTLQNPLGIGTSTFLRYHLEQPHNVYLTMFLAAGWIGGFAYILAVVLTLGAGIVHSLTPGPMQRLQILASAAFAGLVVQGFLVETDHWRHFFLIQALVIGLADAALRARAYDREAASAALRARASTRFGTLASTAAPQGPPAPPIHAPKQRPMTKPARRPVPSHAPLPAPDQPWPRHPARVAQARGIETANRSQMENDMGVHNRKSGPTRAEIAARASHNELAALLKQRQQRQAQPFDSVLAARIVERGPLEKSGTVSATHLLRRRIARGFAA